VYGGTAHVHLSSGLRASLDSSFCQAQLQGSYYRDAASSPYADHERSGGRARRRRRRSSDVDDDEEEEEEDDDPRLLRRGRRGGARGGSSGSDDSVASSSERSSGEEEGGTGDENADLQDSESGSSETGAGLPLQESGSETEATPASEPPAGFSGGRLQQADASPPPPRERAADAAAASSSAAAGGSSSEPGGASAQRGGQGLTAFDDDMARAAARRALHRARRAAEAAADSGQSPAALIKETLVEIVAQSASELKRFTAVNLGPRRHSCALRLFTGPLFAHGDGTACRCVVLSLLKCVVLTALAVWRGRFSIFSPKLSALSFRLKHSKKDADGCTLSAFFSIQGAKKDFTWFSTTFDQLSSRELVLYRLVTRNKEYLARLLVSPDDAGRTTSEKERRVRGRLQAHLAG
jgi:hypothetical protein